MPIFPANNCVFVHIPKTGGTAVEAHLLKNGPLLMYSTAEKVPDEESDFMFNKVSKLAGDNLNFKSSYQHFLPNEIIEWLKINQQEHFETGLVDFDPMKAKWFCIVRDPYERISSEIRYGMSFENKNEITHEEALSLASSWFDKAKEDMSFRDNHIRPQSDYVEQLNSLPVDKLILKYSDLLKIQNGLNVEIPELEKFSDCIPSNVRINIYNEHIKDDSILSPELRQLVESFYQKDFETIFK